MSISKTVVISCAGVGSRLGMGTTKALIEISGKPLIAWQLGMLKDIEDVRVVVGYQAEQVIQTVLSFRKDISFVFNHNYKSTGTAASLALGAEYSKNMVVSLDGDLLVHPDDLRMFLSLEEESLGYCEITSEEPVLINIEEKLSGQWIKSFSRVEGQYEWSGLVQLKPESIHMTNHHVYQLLEPLLPLRGYLIRCREIDTPTDYDAAVKWVEENYKGS